MRQQFPDQWIFQQFPRQPFVPVDAAGIHQYQFEYPFRVSPRKIDGPSPSPGMPCDMGFFNFQHIHEFKNCMASGMKIIRPASRQGAGESMAGHV